MPKHTLSPELIIQTALDLVAESDVESLSFRRLAQRLDVTAMAIYRHFENKEELLSEMLDAFIQQADVLPDDQNMKWDQWLR